MMIWIKRGRDPMLRTIPILLLLAACGQATHDADADQNRQSAGSANGTIPAVPIPLPVGTKTSPDFSGRWVGVEGMYLVVNHAGDGSYAIEMQYDLDHKGRYVGRAMKGGIAFKRDGKTLTLKPGDGEDTGLKWLAGKTDCLIVAPGEGYCRD